MVSVSPLTLLPIPSGPRPTWLDYSELIATGAVTVIALALGLSRAGVNSGLHIITDIIKRGQRDGSFRPDFDAVSKAVEILAFINGMETLWLLDPSIPLTEVFKGYAESLGRELAPRSST